MSEMLERVAKAIERERWVIAMEQMLGARITSLEGSRRTARAAVEALCEPSEAMLHSGAAFCQNHPSAGAEHIADAAYRAMIDAAIGK